MTGCNAKAARLKRVKVAHMIGATMNLNSAASLTAKESTP